MSCLFDSMHHLLARHGVKYRSSHELRRKVVEVMVRNPNFTLPAPAPRAPTFTPGRCDKCDRPGCKTGTCPWFPKAREDSREGGGVTISEWIKMVSGDMNMTAGSYIAAMGRTSTWGGALELAILSKLFNVKIVVTRGNREVGGFDCTSGNPAAEFVLNWTGSHYTPVTVRTPV